MGDVFCGCKGGVVVAGLRGMCEECLGCCVVLIERAQTLARTPADSASSHLITCQDGAHVQWMRMMGVLFPLIWETNGRTGAWTIRNLRVMIQLHKVEKKEKEALVTQQKGEWNVCVTS